MGGEEYTRDRPADLRRATAAHDVAHAPDSLDAVPSHCDTHASAGIAHGNEYRTALSHGNPCSGCDRPPAYSRTHLCGRISYPDPLTADPYAADPNLPATNPDAQAAVDRL
jgi:hypothetical protein